ncbi:DUF47 domain-containing protein [Mucilaginibacter xinganensis]|uniref:Phosphate transport regulator n=1 Tax=Mucilaginibacter xinganensis TaxID=1234841 RepID=A0A223NTM7_9SPHI|nr:DUF47 family protein [Mucilaginibacter xinganensis]ASU33176.1 hypothetical protein MuYL_1278 [Mucilaginibacter xinganensis]
MKALFQDFFTNKALFFNQFDHAARNMTDMAGLLTRITGDGITAESGELFKQIDKMEHTGDGITHKIYLALDKIMFTPLNRNDIHSLAGAIDDVADMIKEAASRINLYNISIFISPLIELALLIKKACAEIQTAVGLLKVHRQEDAILIACRKIKEYERHADRLYYNALADLFLTDKDPINLIKYREILQSLESTLNKCKSTADVLEVILINR